MKHVLVTGGCGFIGSAFVDALLREPGIVVVNLDCLDTCATTLNVTLRDSDRYTFVHGLIQDAQLVDELLVKYCIDTVVHFAAQSHVDTSFSKPLAYTHDNVYGTHVLLECVRRYGKLDRFVHISTDEVYGDSDNESKTENSVMCPTNPYAATKAAAELLVKSYHHSFGLPVIVTRSNNVFGPRQYPEKVIPKFIMQIMRNESITVHGNGSNLRSWVYIDDAVSAIKHIAHNGRVGDTYNIGSTYEVSVLELAHRITTAMGKHDVPIAFVKDRPYNDKRYFVCDAKLRNLGWTQRWSFEQGLEKTIEWYTMQSLDDYWTSSDKCKRHM